MRGFGRWTLFRIVFPLLPYVIAVTLILVRMGDYSLEALKSINWWEGIFQAPEILYLGIVISASGLKDVSDIRTAGYSKSFHEGLFWLLIILVVIAAAVYGDLRGTRIRGLATNSENPNFIFPVVLTAVMTFLSAVAHASLLRLKRRGALL